MCHPAPPRGVIEFPAPVSRQFQFQFAPGLVSRPGRFQLRSHQLRRMLPSSRKRAARLSKAPSYSARDRRTARPPHRNSTRTVCRTFSILRITIGPISPVARTCVPPHALRSRPSMTTIRNSPSRAEAFRRPCTSAASRNSTVTGRFSNTMALARCSVSWTVRSSTPPASRSMVELSEPR